MMADRSDRERMERYARMSTEQIREDHPGLQTGEVEKRRDQYGSNKTEIKRDTLALRLRRSFINPFSVVLLILAVISCFVDILFAEDGHRNGTTVIIISVMLLISGCIRFAEELSSKKTMDRIMDIVDASVLVKRDGRWVRMEGAELVVGDRVRLSAGERVPADIRITGARACFISESALTGESELQEKNAESVSETAGSMRSYRNMAFCGTTVANGTFEGVVVAVGYHTFYGEIMPASPKRKQGYDRGAHSIARILIRFMVLLVPLVFIASGLTKGNWVSAFLFAISAAVGLTPELLPMVITACLAKGSFHMGRKQAVVKNINAMQGFGSMDVLCVDKTGTLTEDRLIPEYYMDILGNESQTVLDMAYLNSFYHAGIHSHLDRAILQVQEMSNRVSKRYYEDLADQYEKLDERPFDYHRKIATVLLKSPQDEAILIAKGGVDAILGHCRYAFYKGERIPMDEDSYRSVHAVVDEMLEDGMKVLAVAARKTAGGPIGPEDETDLVLLGYVTLFDAPRKSAASAIRKLNDLHVGTIVLTGDNRDVAISICRRLGMDTGRVLTGAEIDGLSDDEIQVQVEDTQIFAELSPAQKAKIIGILQSNGHVVGYLADGMNDLPAVLQSDVGISVDTAVPAVKECADVILLKKDLNVLESGITEGRRAFANMSKYVKITASSNLGNILAMMAAGIFLPFFPMTSIQILLLNLLYDLLCLVLPWDHVDREMYGHPLEWSGKSLSRFMLVFGPISSLFDMVTFLFLYKYVCPLVTGGVYGALAPAAQAEFIAVFQTGWFLESMWTQILILHLLRTARFPFLESRPSAPVLAVTLLGILAFTCLSMTPVGSLIGLTVLPPVYFVFLVADVFGYLLVVSWAKHIYIRRYHTLI